MTLEKKLKKENKQTKILVVNDDIEDILSLQQQLPKAITLLSASQFQARNLGQYGFDLIILDNDANNGESSKGKDTLQEMIKKGVDIPILYTSFQPGRVDKIVYTQKNVSVVRTDTLPKVLSEKYGLVMRELPKTEKLEPQTSVIVTYNGVSGYTAGTYSNGKLVIVSHDRFAEELAVAVTKENLQKLYKNFDFRTDRDLIKNIFVYDGLKSGEESRNLAASLGHSARMKVHLLACMCDWGRKQMYASSMYVMMHKITCGGNDELGIIADTILGITRPGVNYENFVIPREQILTPAEKFT